MTQSQLNQSGFIFIAGDIAVQPITYRSYLNEYGKDETTTPHGIDDKMHIREVKGDENVTVEWQIWTWGYYGSNATFTGQSFDNEEEAELYLYEQREWYVREKNWDAPTWLATYDEAVTDMANQIERPEGVVRRYLSISAIAANKAAAHRAEVTRQNDERKARLAIDVPKEADSLVIDDEFKAAIQWAEQATGHEKGSRMASAMKGLLSRNGKDQIYSDFWQVLRILKAKVEKAPTR